MNTRRGKLMEIIFERNSKKRKALIQQKRQEPQEATTMTIASSSTMKLYGAGIRDAYGLHSPDIVICNASLFSYVVKCFMFEFSFIRY